MREGENLVLRTMVQMMPAAATHDATTMVGMRTFFEMPPPPLSLPSSFLSLATDADDDGADDEPVELAPLVLVSVSVCVTALEPDAALERRGALDESAAEELVAASLEEADDASAGAADVADDCAAAALDEGLSRGAALVACAAALVVWAAAALVVCAAAAALVSSSPAAAALESPAAGALVAASASLIDESLAPPPPPRRPSRRPVPSWRFEATTRLTMPPWLRLCAAGERAECAEARATVLPARARRTALVFIASVSLCLASARLCRRGGERRDRTEAVG